MSAFSRNPSLYLIWVGVGLPGFAFAALTAAFWLRFDAPIWGAF
jgi:hypothetical protein